MVFISRTASNDLRKILLGLINWKKVILDREYCINYVSEIIKVCRSIDHLSIHLNSEYSAHKKFGQKVYKYKRNRNTTWYIIYDYDKPNNIVYIKHINSNHTTESLII